MTTVITDEVEAGMYSSGYISLFDEGDDYDGENCLQA